MGVIRALAQDLTTLHNKTQNLDSNGKIIAASALDSQVMIKAIIFG